MNSNQRLNKLIRKGIRGKHDETVHSHRDCLPNFIIIGAAKSATTTLTTILPQHPDVFISKPKEPKFFGRYYEKGWDWYASRFTKGESYRLRGEGSTMYSSQLKSFRHTPELMHRYLPDAKLIYIVRHPLDRIVSQWRHYRGRNPDCPDFSQLMSDRHLRRLIVGCSMYYQSLSSFKKYFPDEQIYCMTFEDLLSKPRQSLRQMMQFLGVRPKVRKMLDSNGNLPKENPAGDKGRDYVEKPEWDPDVKQRVLRKIQPDTQQMLAYMGKPLDFWKL